MEYGDHHFTQGRHATGRLASPQQALALSLVLHATKTRAADRLMACLDAHRQVEPYGLFEPQRVKKEGS